MRVVFPLGCEDDAKCSEWGQHRDLVGIVAAAAALLPEYRLISEVASGEPRKTFFPGRLPEGQGSAGSGHLFSGWGKLNSLFTGSFSLFGGSLKRTPIRDEKDLASY